MLILNLLRKDGEAVYFIIDDTFNKKRGKHILAEFKFFDHISKQYIWGQQLVCAIIEYRGISIPYAIEVYIPIDTAEAKGYEFKKKTQIALEILKEFEANEKEEVFVVADTYYASPSIMSICRKRKYNFVSMLKTNRILNISNEKMNFSSYIKQYFTERSRKSIIKIGSNKYKIHSRVVRLKNGGAVKLVCTRSQSHRTVKTIFTTNSALPVEKILKAYSKRWPIEIFFKMSKQDLCLRAYQSRNLEATQSSLRLSLMSYNLLTHAFLEKLREKGKRITDKNLAHFSLVDIRDHLRNITMIDSIEYCLEKNTINTKELIISNMLLAS
jgi:hypothetical protein